MQPADALGEAINLPDRKLSPARRRANGIASGGTTGAPFDAARVFLTDELFAVRESSEYGYMLFEKMIQQTLEPYREIPGVARALELGVSVFERGLRGDKLRRQLGARALIKPGTDRVFGLLFRLDGTWFLYALTSAVRTSTEGDNLWIDTVCDVLRELRPRNLRAGPASRIARRKELAGKVTIALHDLGTRLFLFEAQQGLDVREAGGSATWDALVTAADYDHRNNQSRLLTGTIFELKNNRFPRAEAVLPPGFRFARDGDAGRVVGRVIPDNRPEVLQMVRDLLVAGGSDRTNAEIAEEFSARGLRARKPGMTDVPVADVADPGRAVLSVFEHLRTYLTGIYTFRLECPIPYLEEMHGLRVHRVHHGDRGYFEVDLKFGLPPDGFLDEATALAVMERRLGREPGTSGVQQDRSARKPMAGRRTWSDGTFQYVLDADESTAYVVRRRPVPSGPQTSMRKGEGEIIGRLPAQRFHADLAESALAGLGRSLPTDRPAAAEAPAWLGSLTDDVAALRSAMEAGDREARNYRELAGSASDVEERNEYAELARAAHEEAQQARRDLAAAQGQLALASPGGAHIDVGALLPALVLLKETPGKAPFESYEAIRDHVIDVRVDCSQTSPTAQVEFLLRVRSTDGSIALGPMRFTTRNTAVGVAGTPARADAFHERNKGLLLPWLIGEESAADLQHREGMDERALFRRAHGVLERYIPGSTARAVLLDCPVPETRATVLATAMGLELPTPYSQERAELIQRTYLDPNFEWPQSWVSEATAPKRLPLAFVDRNSIDPERGVHLDEVLDTLSIPEVFVYRLLNTDPTRYTGASKRDAPRPVLDRVPGWPEDRGRDRTSRRVRVFSCRWCGEWSMLQPLRVPEVVGELICTTCQCSADSDEPWPALYLDLWDGPFGRGRAAAGTQSQAQGRCRAGSRIVDLPAVPLLGTRRRAR